MNVEWILQGFSLGFTGFFVEYLGLSSSIVQLLPYSTLQKSSYRKTFNESYFVTEYSIFNKELFPKEAKNIEYLISRNYSKYRSRSDSCCDNNVINSTSNHNNNKLNNNHSDNTGGKITPFYHPRFLYTSREQSVIQPSICIDFKSSLSGGYPNTYNVSGGSSNSGRSINVEKYILNNTALIGGDLARGYVSLNDAKSAFECCEYCYSNILCLSWSYDNKTGEVVRYIR